MTPTLADIEALVDDLEDGLFDRPEEAVQAANRVADLVVEVIEHLTALVDNGGGAPSERVQAAYDELVEAAESAQRGYEAAQRAYPAGSVERDALILVAGYWQMRAATARLESSIAKDRSAMLAEMRPAAPAPPPRSQPVAPVGRAKPGLDREVNRTPVRPPGRQPLHGRPAAREATNRPGPSRRLHADARGDAAGEGRTGKIADPLERVRNLTRRAQTPRPLGSTDDTQGDPDGR